MRERLKERFHRLAANRKIVSLLFAFVVGTMVLYPTEAMAQKVSVRIEQGTLDQAFQALMKKSKIQLVYNTDVAAKINCKSHNFTQEEVGDILTDLLAGTQLTYQVKDGIYTIVKKAATASRPQKGRVRGKVLDPNNEPVIGAAVLLVGTTKGSVTDIDGNFVIEDVERKNATLRVSYIGYKTVEQTVALNSNTVFNLKEDANLMNEVVVTGYQDISKEKMTGSITTVRSTDFEERYTVNILDNLEGRVAGLTTYGGKTTIRGTSSLYAETNPLLVVDGLPIEGDIEDLNPYDIESVNVLKDAAATAIYGARASNGIIVVTTKNAKKKGKIDIEFAANLTIKEKRNMDYNDNFYLDAAQQVALDSEYYEYYYFNNDGEVADPIGSEESNIMMGSMAVGELQYAYYQLAKGEISRDQLESIKSRLSKNNFAKEYADAVYKQQTLQQYNLSVRSRSDKYSSNLTLNYKYDNSGIINAHDNALNINYKGVYEMADWLTATFSINGIYGNRKEAGYDYNSFHASPWNYPAYESLTYADGTPKKLYGWYDGNAYWNQNEDGMHDLGISLTDEFYNNTQTTKRQHMRYHGDLLFKVIKGLTINTQFIYETNHTTVNWHANEASHPARLLRNAYAVKDAGGNFTYMTPSSGGFLQTTNTDGEYWTARGQVNYTNTFGKHSVAALAGLEFRQTKYNGSKSLILGYDEQLQTSSTHTVDLGTLSQMRNSPYFLQGMFPAQQFAFGPYLEEGMGIVTENLHRYASGYANLTYTYDEKYNVFGSFRKDYADVYGLNAKFRGKPLWSVGAGWNMHNEDFMKRYDWINFLKLRFSYGVTGNIYQGATSYMTATSGTINSFTNLPNGTIISPANPNLKWEQSRTTNVGVDFSLLNNRLRGSLDYYKKVGKDIFANRTLDPTTGFSSMFVNAAAMENKGIEVALTYDWLVEKSRKDIGWSTSFTLSHNKNEITEVENPATRAYELLSTPYKKGYPSSALWSYRFAGISDVPGEKGQTLWYIEDGNTAHNAAGKSVEILEYSGQTEPKVVMGMDNRLTWNGFSLSVLMAYYGGHQMRALVESETFTPSYGPIASYFQNAWTPENPTSTPGYGRYASTSIGSEPRYANTAVHDADFLKIRNIVFGYEFPQQWIQKLGINRLNLRFQIDNPKALWVKNDIGVDPETLGLRNPSSFIFGLNINL